MCSLSTTDVISFPIFLSSLLHLILFSRFCITLLTLKDLKLSSKGFNETTLYVGKSCSKRIRRNDSRCIYPAALIKNSKCSL